MIRSAALVAVAVFGIAACGDAEPESSVDSIPGAGADASGGATVPGTTAPTTPTGDDEECTSDLRLFEVAMEAHVAQFGRYPDLESDLVDVEFLRSEIDTYDLVDGEIVRVAGEPCAPADEVADGEPSSLPTSSDGWFELFTPEQIAGLGGAECAQELAVIAAAAQLFSEREGREPDTLAEIDDDLEVPVTLWRWSDDDLVPTEGSGCIDPNRLEVERACLVDARTLEVAREAYVAQFGAETEPTEDDLIAAEFIRIASDAIDLVDGEAVATPGGECEGVDLDPAPTPSESADACTTDYRTLQVAIEAYVIQQGREPDNEGQLLDAGILGGTFDTYDVVYGEIVPGDGSPCEVPPN